MSEIDAYGSNRGGIAQTNSNCIGVVASETAEADSAIDIAAIVEQDSAKRFHDPQRKTNFGVKNEKLSPTHRHGDFNAPCLIL